MATLKHCMACVTAQAGRQASTPPEAVFLNAMSFCQLYGIANVLKSLCHVHRDHLRKYQKIAEGRARAMED